MKRSWKVELDPESGEGYSELEDAVMDLTTILLRCGGVGAIAPHRIEQSDGTFTPTAVIVRYDSYAPGLNRDGEPEEEVPELALVNGDGEDERIDPLRRAIRCGPGSS